MQLLAVALGSALGGCLRYLATLGVNALMQRGFPWGTLTVNVAGCLLIGVLHVLVVERGGGAESLRLFAMVGVLGGFTTFSSFSLETLLLVQQGASVAAYASVLDSDNCAPTPRARRRGAISRARGFVLDVAAFKALDERRKLLERRARSKTVALRRRRAQSPRRGFVEAFAGARRAAAKPRSRPTGCATNAACAAPWAGQGQGQDVAPLLAEVATLGADLERAEAALAAVQAEVRMRWLLGIPNLLHESVPEGRDETANVEVRRAASRAASISSRGTMSHWGRPWAGSISRPRAASRARASR